MYAITNFPVESFTRATFLTAEFGFFGFVYALLMIFTRKKRFDWTDRVYFITHTLFEWTTEE